ncbi:SdpI family protein [Nesterenkonia sp. LB17]|uniref:SdpI family protein n=1 Tax=Nesterenkonia sp. LB17 TaxID=2901230 RepID=UPI00351D5D46
MERLPINPLIGIRIPSTMADPETWTRSHKAVWVWTTVSGAGLSVSGVIVLVTQDDSGLWGGYSTVR